MSENTTTTQDVVTPTTSTNEEKGVKTFTQDEVNELISKRINEVNSKNKTNTEEAINKALAEYKRQAKLTQEERDKEAHDRRDAELKSREDNITLRERRLDAQEELRKNNIPIDLVDFVISLDADQTKDNIDKLVSVYQKSVEAGIADKLKGQPPQDFSTNNNTVKKVISGTF